MDFLIRNLDEEIVLKLKREAKTNDMSLNMYIKYLLESYTVKNDIVNIDEKYQNMVSEITMIYSHQMKKTEKVIEKNNYLINKLLSERR